MFVVWEKRKASSVVNIHLEVGLMPWGLSLDVGTSTCEAKVVLVGFAGDQGPD